MTDRQPTPSRSRLAPGVRVSDRGDGTLQVGVHADRRLVVADDPAARDLLDRLRHGLDPTRLPAGQRDLLRRLERTGLLQPALAPSCRTVAVDAAEPERSAVLRALADAGLEVAADGSDAALTVVVRSGAEPRREDVDRLVQADRAHLLLVALAGRVRVGPLVVPGATACVRCVDEHLTDEDPRHPLVVHQHLERDAADRPDLAGWLLGSSWAAHDAAAYLLGRRPTTWSTTVELTEAGPRRRSWARHPRCGCAWGDLLDATG